MPNIAGHPGVVELEPEREWDSRHGWRTVRRWRGTKAAIYGFIPAITIAGTLLRVIPEDTAMATLEARFDDAQDGSSADNANQLQTVWTLAGNDLEKDIFTHPRWTAYVLAAPNDAIRIIAFRGDQTLGYPNALAGDGILFANLVQEKVESYSVSQFVLRRTTTLGSQSTVQASVANVGNQYTTAALIAAETIPNTIKFVLPAGAWVKRTPTVEQLSNGKFQITQEWWNSDSADTLLYPVAS